MSDETKSGDLRCLCGASALVRAAEIARDGCYQVMDGLVLVSVRDMARLVRDARHADDKWTAVLDADEDLQ